MKKKLFLIFFVFLLFISLVNAQPPFQEISGTSDVLDIRFPQVNFVKLGQDITSHTHVFNITNGLIKTNETTDCIVHLYNSSGSHILEEYMAFDDNGLDFELTINSSIFVTLGDHSFIIQCNDSLAGGFVSGMFEVTETGEPESEYNSIKTVAALLGLLIIAGLFLVFAFKLDEEHYIIKIFFMLMSLITLIVIPQVIINGISSAKENLTRIPLWAFYIFIIYLSVYVVYNWARNSERFLKWFGRQK